MVAGLAATALARTSLAGFTEASPGDTDRPMPLFLLDPRVLQSHAAASAALAAGADTFLLEPDVTAVWQYLDEAWRESGGAAPFAVCGVTAGNVLFVIERLARDYGLRMIYRRLHTQGEHADWAGLGRGLVKSAFVPRSASAIVTTPTEPDPDGATFSSWLLAPLSGQPHRV